MLSNKIQEWDICKFENIFEIPLRNGLDRPKRVRGEGIKMVNMGEIFAYDRIFNPPMDRVPVSTEEYDKVILKKGDLLFARQSLVLEGAGKSSIIMEDKEPLTFESHIIRVRLNKSITNPLFYYYFFKSFLGKGLISSIVEQVAASGIRGSDLKNLPVYLPPLPEQKAIARILSSLDDKIEINNKINKNLEEIGQALFKRWFVDFEFPDEEGMPYKSNGGKMVESDLRMIPEGWRKYNLTDLLDTISVSHKFQKSKVIFLNTSDILDGIFLHKNYSDISKLPGQAKKTIKKGDILFSEIRPANKRYAYVNFDADDYVVSTKLMVLRSKGIIDSLVLYFYLKSYKVLRELQLLAEARSGTFPQITYSELEKLEMNIPDEKIKNQYTKIIQSLFSEIQKNQQENQSLSQLRDTLLPRLMSGKIRVTPKEDTFND